MSFTFYLNENTNSAVVSFHHKDCNRIGIQHEYTDSILGVGIILLRLVIQTWIGTEIKKKSEFKE